MLQALDHLDRVKVLNCLDSKVVLTPIKNGQMTNIEANNIGNHHNSSENSINSINLIGLWSFHSMKFIRFFRAVFAGSKKKSLISKAFLVYKD